MVTPIAFSQHLLISHPPLSFPVVSSLGFKSFPETRRGLRRAVASFDTFLAKESFSLGFSVVRGRGTGSGSWWCWCKGREESDGEAGLEAEILECMNKSEKPEAFPTKEELVNGGRIDLVEAILKKGGWLSMGWDSDDENDEKEGFLRYCSESADFNIADFQDRVESLQENTSFKEAEVESTHSSQLASPSGTSLDTAAEDITGIEGILNRLEKERNLTLGIDLGSNGYKTNASSENDGHRSQFRNLADANRADLRENSRPTSDRPAESTFNSSVGKLSSNGSLSDINDLRYSFNPEMWRAWSSQRAGFTDTEFEAAEIIFDEDTVKGENENSQDERLSITGGGPEAVDRWNEININQILTRLQHLELELASALHSLRSKSKEIIPKGHESTSSELQKLSDVWEFQENEIMNAQDKLRSICAKLAILEGKMALAIIESQKIVEEKQRKIDGARRSLQLLRSTCIVWPSSASEVLLTGSFDGWTTQRKMEKSRTGIFSVCLQLYPGRYEIKFIVDGIWRIDPLRPIVHNNGYENNLVIIT